MNEEDVTRYPLCWPSAYGRTLPEDRKSSWKFKRSTFGSAVYELCEELRKMGVYREDIKISSNVPVRKDGLPYASRKIAKGADPGVAVYWEDPETNESLSLACDTYDSVHGNLRGLGLTVAALRSLERHGSREIMKRAFTGFKALPGAVALPPTPWWEVLEMEHPNSHTTILSGLVVAKHNYHTLLKKHHPDRGGDPEAMAELNRAWKEAQDYYR